ncbi:MAG: hypothetical protein ABI551_18140, partial [Polyangiaceae bacterium]
GEKARSVTDVVPSNDNGNDNAETLGPAEALDAPSARVETPASSGRALIEARGLRIDRDGSPEVDRLSFATKASPKNGVLVLGAPHGLFEAAAGLVKPAAGELLIKGEPAFEAAQSSKVAGAAASMPLPDKWTLERYVTWSARLGGATKAMASVGAHRAISRLDLREHADTPFEKTPPHVRILAPLAAALATGAETLVIEDPLTTLPSDHARDLARRMLAALEDRRWVFFAGKIAPGAPFALAADEAVVVGGNRVVQGGVVDLAAREGTYAVRIHGEARTFARLVGSSGGTTRGDGDDLLVDLGATLHTRDLFDLADQAHSVIVELRPLSRAFV